MSAPPVLPSADEEIWRYSRIGELDLARFAPGSCRTETVGADPWRTSADLAGLVMTEPVDVFAGLNSANAAARPEDVVALSVPAGSVAETPIEIIHRLESDGVVAHPRVVVDAGENSEVTIVERFFSAPGVVSLVCPVLEIRAHQAARVNYVVVNQFGTGVWQIAHQRAEGARDSALRLSTIALGGDYARVRSSVRLVGQGADAQQTALYFAGGDQMHDFRTTQVHSAPRTRSDLLFKGAVRDRARSVYTGLIHIERDATGSEAYQTNRNLTLSEGAWAESVPNLEIETNEVKCSHASTVGPVDEDQRFYLESRGIEPSVAERLVVLGFFNEVLGRMPASLRLDDVSADIASKLLAEVAP